MTAATPISYGEYAKALAGLQKEAADGKAELLAAHEAEANAEKAYRIGQAREWAKADGRTGDERKAQVDAACAGLRAARDIARGRVNVAQEALRDIRSRRSSGDELARYARRAMELDTPGPDVAPLLRSAA